VFNWVYAEESRATDGTVRGGNADLSDYLLTLLVTSTTVTLYDLLQQWVDGEHEHARTRRCIWRWPPVCIFQLDRQYHAHEEGTARLERNGKHIGFPGSFSAGDRRYRLCGVVVYDEGREHYITYALKRRWYEFDDGARSPVDPTRVFSQVVDLLVYEACVPVEDEEEDDESGEAQVRARESDNEEPPKKRKPAEPTSKKKKPAAKKSAAKKKPAAKKSAAKKKPAKSAAKPGAKAATKAAAKPKPSPKAAADPPSKKSAKADQQESGQKGEKQQLN